MPSSSFAAGTETGGHPERDGERFDDLLRRRRHDVRGTAGVAVDVDQFAGLRTDLAEQRREHPLVEGQQIVLPLALDEAEDAIAGVIAGAGVVIAVQLERGGRHGVAEELVGRHHLHRPGRDGEGERRRSGDQGAVEIEERCARADGGNRHVLAHAREGTEVERSDGFAGGR